MRVLIVSSQTVFAQGMDTWLRQQAGVDSVQRETSLGTAARCSRQLQPDVILLDITHKAKELSTALVRFLQDRSGARVIGVDLQDHSACLDFEDRLVMQDMGDLWRVIQEAGTAACSRCRAKEG